MDEMAERREIVTDDLHLLGYLQHMARTAQTDAAERLYELFAGQEQRRLEADDCIRLTAASDGSGGEQMPFASVSTGDHTID